MNELQVPPLEASRLRMMRGMMETEGRQREAILAALAETDGPATLMDLAHALDLNPGLVRSRVNELMAEGLIEPRGEVVELAAAHRRIDTRRTN